MTSLRVAHVWPCQVNAPDVAGLQHVVDAHGAVEELLYAPPEELYALRALVAK